VNLNRPEVVIRHANPADLEAVLKIFSGPKVIRGTLQLPFPSKDLWRQRLTEPERGLILLMACVEGEPVGMVGLHTRPDTPRTRHAAMGITVRDDWQGRRIGTALMKAAVDMADNWLQLIRLELNVLVDNEPAIRLYRRFQFEIEGTLRKAAFVEGRLEDVYVMGRLLERGAS
jgi:putative acetyltransferase